MTRMRGFCWAAIGAALALMMGGPAVAATTVVVVRHAEKVNDPTNRDPELSEAGVERAAALARTLADLPVTGVYSSGYIRTKETARPTAELFGLEVEVRDPRDSQGLSDEILRERSGECVLVVGHSNTVPAMLAALGVADPPALSESDYDDLFIVRVPDDGSEPMLLWLHTGAPDPAE